MDISSFLDRVTSGVIVEGVVCSVALAGFDWEGTGFADRRMRSLPSRAAWGYVILLSVLEAGKNRLLAKEKGFNFDAQHTVYMTKPRRTRTPILSSAPEEKAFVGSDYLPGEQRPIICWSAKRARSDHAHTGNVNGLDFRYESRLPEGQSVHARFDCGADSGASARIGIPTRRRMGEADLKISRCDWRIFLVGRGVV